MPNWCHNKLTVTGRPADVDEFVDLVAADNHGQKIDVTWQDEPVTVNQPLTFEKIVPGRPGEDGDWYGWSVRCWGTKWDANFGAPFVALGTEPPGEEGRTPVIEPGRAFYAFETAWSPPVEAFEQAARRWDMLKFELEFAEPGNDYAGRVTWEGGMRVADTDLAVDDVLLAEEMWF